MDHASPGGTFKTSTPSLAWAGAPSHSTVSFPRGSFLWNPPVHKRSTQRAPLGYLRRNLQSCRASSIASISPKFPTISFPTASFFVPTQERWMTSTMNLSKKEGAVANSTILLSWTVSHLANTTRSSGQPPASSFHLREPISAISSLAVASKRSKTSKRQIPVPT